MIPSLDVVDLIRKEPAPRLVEEIRVWNVERVLTSLVFNQTKDWYDKGASTKESPWAKVDIYHQIRDDKQ